MSLENTVAFIVQKAIDADWTNIIVGFGSAIIGALIGARASYRVQQLQVAQERSAAALSLLFRAQYIHSNLVNIKKSIAKCEEEAVHASLQDAPPCIRIQPLAGLPKPSSYTSEELAVLAIGKQYDTIPELSTQSMRLESTIDALNLYAEVRTQWAMRQPVQRVLQGNVIGVGVAEQDPQGVPYFVQANSLMQQILSHLDGDVASSAELVNGLGQKLRLALNDSKFPILQVTT
jgi:hypothetical protein